MKSAFVRWLIVLALANWFIYASNQWAMDYLITNYQVRRVQEETHAMIARELPHFDLLPADQWEEAARTFHERWHETPAKLSSLEEAQIEVWNTTQYFNSRVRYDYNFPSGAFAYVLMKDHKTLLVIGPLPGLFVVSALDNIVWISLWIAVNGSVLYWMLAGWHRRAKAINRATSGFLLDGVARLIQDDSVDALGLAAHSVNRMAERAEQLLRQRQQMIHEQRELLHAVAHECRAPLARLNFALEMLEHSESTTQRHQLSHDMENAITELDGLVRELLTYARLQHGAQKLELTETDVGIVVDDVLDKTKLLFPSIVFSADMGELKGKPQVDTRLFARCLTNLVRNAAAFANGAVKVSWRTVQQNLELRVEDDGPGIPDDQRDRIFEPFVRLDPSRSRDSGGTGLGLAIVKGISERHHGDVFVEDSSLGGACFVLRWPMTA